MPAITIERYRHLAGRHGAKLLIATPDAMTTDLPDLVFTVSSLPSPVAKHLIDRHGYRPVELAVSDAFRLDWHEGSFSNAGNGDPQHRVLRKSIVEATIPAFTYQVSPPVPREPLRTLGTRLQLIVHRDTPPAAVERVVDSVYGTNFANVSEPMLTIDLLRTAPEFELHAGATIYF